jgi:hypothetical protein
VLQRFIVEAFVLNLGSLIPGLHSTQYSTLLRYPIKLLEDGILDEIGEIRERNSPTARSRSS